MNLNVLKMSRFFIVSNFYTDRQISKIMKMFNLERILLGYFLYTNKYGIVISKSQVLQKRNQKTVLLL
jgi:hypothetical protein